MGAATATRRQTIHVAATASPRRRTIVAGAECAKVEAEAWHGPLEPAGALPPTASFAIPDWSLPDFDRELRDANGDVAVHVTAAPLFSAEECAEVVAMADAHAKKANGWSAIPAGGRRRGDP